MASNTEKFLAALGNSLMDLSGMTAENGPDAIADALVGGGGANAYGIGSAAGLASTQTGAVMHALTDGDTTGESPLIHVRRGSANVTYLMPGARWYINHVLGIPWQQSEPGSMLPAGNIASPST
jgi:hypothetical protein